MVKIRGYRVEPEVIANALAAHPNIRECEVMARPNPNTGEPRLVAYFAPRQLPMPTASELRSLLSAALPSYMVPARFVGLQSLPFTLNGKVDRKSLPPPGRARPELSVPFSLPRSELEAQIAIIWAELLELDEVGIEDNFFELGGDSLSAVSMIAQVESISNQTVPQDYFRTPTISALAELCQAGAAPHEPVPLPLAPQPQPGQTRRQLARLVTGQKTASAILGWAIRKRVLGMPYEQGLRWLARVGQASIARRLFAEEGELFLSLAQGLGNPAAASPEAFGASMLGNNLWICFQEGQSKIKRSPGGRIEAMLKAPDLFWRSFAERIDHAPKAERGRLINFNGLEHLYHAQKSGRGTILLTYHSPATPIASSILARITGLRHIQTLSLVQSDQMAEREFGDEAESPADKARFNQRRSGWSAAFTLQGHRILSQKGVLQIVNDISYTQGRYFRRSIGRRWYDLKPGFAELALLTGAAVLPAFSWFDAAGCIHLTLLPELKPLSSSAAHLTRVEQMIDQYTAFVEDSWRKLPESVSWGALRRYANQPVSLERTSPAL